MPVDLHYLIKLMKKADTPEWRCPMASIGVTHLN